MNRRNPLRRLLLVALLVGVPVLEIVVIIAVGRAIGVAWTILALLGLMLIGSWALKREGRRAWHKLRRAVEDGKMPAREVTDGVLVLVGGLLMIVPGFVTAAVGALLLLPPTRAALRPVLGASVGRWVARQDPGRLRMYGPVYRASSSRGPATQNHVVEGEIVDHPGPSS
jgi:UPF0716 protein FxsA